MWLCVCEGMDQSVMINLNTRNRSGAASLGAYTCKCQQMGRQRSATRDQMLKNSYYRDPDCI